MPSLDMSDGLLEPVFQDYFAVIRRTATISDKGRQILTPQRFPRVLGIVTAASPNDLERLGDYQYQGVAISVVTRFKLFGIGYQRAPDGVDSAGQPEPQFQPDLILWDGSAYLCVTIENYSRYGTGFIQCVAVSQDYIDAKPQPFT